MQKKIENFMEEHHMVKRGECILAAVSGGADSLCLLLILLLLRQAGKIRLCAVHVEHGIRGADSQKDARFVENFCKEQGVPIKVFHCRAEEYARAHKLTVEEGARVLRYSFFAQAAEEFGADKIAVAHNQNDCAETMLFHLVRGTGLKGMSGILPVRGRIIRPLLCAQRKEIEAYLAGRNQEFCQDKTNEELDYSRNKLRRQVFPVLNEVNSQAVTHMCQAAALAAQAWELAEDLSRKAAEQYVCRKERGLVILEGILEEKPLLQTTLLRQALEETAESSQDISGLHVKKLQELFEKQPGRQLDLPYGVKAERIYEGILLEKQAAPKEHSRYQPPGVYPAEERSGEKPPGALPAEEHSRHQPPGVQLAPEGILEIPSHGCEIRTRILENPFQNEEIPKKMYTKWLDYDRIKGILQLRARREGDFLVICPDGKRKKLKNYFIDEKIPRQERDGILLLADETHVLWAIGYRISEDVKVTKDTRRVLEIQVCGGKFHE